MYNLRCDCGACCGKCSAELSLDLCCDVDKMTVTSRDIRSNSGVVAFHASDTDPGISIVKLKKGQEINLRMMAKRGTGRTHAKWSPSTAVSFSYNTEEITITVEASGSLTPALILRAALLIMREKLINIRGELKKN